VPEDAGAPVLRGERLPISEADPAGAVRGQLRRGPRGRLLPGEEEQAT